MTDVIDLAYWAGIIDGEGCISGNRTYHNGQVAYSASIGICHTNLKLLEAFKTTFGLHNGIVRRKIRSSRHKQGYQIKSLGEEATNIVSLLLPFLRLKTDQAKLILHLTEMKYERNKNRERGIILEKLHELNRKGP